MPKPNLIITAIAVAALLGCGADNPTAPRHLKPHLRMDCLAYDPENCTDPGGGTEEYSYESYSSVSGSSTIRVTIPGSPPPGPLVPCPSFYRRLVPATLQTTPPITVVSSGYFFPQLPNIYLGSARYDWPSGWWPETGGSGREAQIESADAICTLEPSSPPYTYTLGITFYSFYGVTTRKLVAGGAGGGDGGTGGGSGCSSEWVALDVDNGHGWVEYWSGYATVCV